MDNELTLNQIIKLGSDHKLLDTNVISDGYHTFGELYQHRIALYLQLAHSIARDRDSTHSVWRSKVHSDGSVMEGWFILGIGVKPGMQITYHLPLSQWENAYFANDLEIAPVYDGHTSADVLKRLEAL